jgi:hypothetical protein
MYRATALPYYLAKNGVKTMTYHITFSGRNRDDWRFNSNAYNSAFRANGIKGCKIVPDGTPTVDAEIVTPVYANCQVAYEHLKSICDAFWQIWAVA